MVMSVISAIAVNDKSPTASQQKVHMTCNVSNAYDADTKQYLWQYMAWEVSQTGVWRWPIVQLSVVDSLWSCRHTHPTQNPTLLVSH